MGLFGKESCILCEKEVGIMSRAKIQGGVYICDSCKYKTHPFMRVDHMNLEEVQQLIVQMEEDAKILNAQKLRDNTIHSGSGNYIHFKDHYETGIFTLITPTSKKYIHEPLFYFDNICEYASSSHTNFAFAETNPDQNRCYIDYKKIISLEQKKDSSGNENGWKIRIPYNDERIKEIILEFSATTKEAELTRFYNSLCSISEGYNRRQLEDRRSKDRLQEKNAYATANKALKAALTGGDVKETFKEGVEKASDIEDGKIKEKKGLFGKLFK